MVVPSRGFLETIKRRITGNFYFGRESKQRNLTQGKYSNDFKVAVHRRSGAIQEFASKLHGDPIMLADIWTLSGLRLIFHCTAKRSCHRDALIDELSQAAFGRGTSSSIPPSSLILNFLARLREEAEQDEGVPTRPCIGVQGHSPTDGSGSGLHLRKLCDGQSPASLGRCPAGQRQYPEGPAWSSVPCILMKYVRRVGTLDLWLQLTSRSARLTLKRYRGSR